jgi:hypothetical protein
LELQSTPGVFVHLISTLIGDDDYTISALARDFDDLAKKRAKYAVSGYPSLPDRKVFHLLAAGKDLLRALVSALSALFVERCQLCSPITNFLRNMDDDPNTRKTRVAAKFAMHP